MSLFPVFEIAGSALTTDRKWMDAIADNIANVNTINPFDQAAFQQRFVIARAKHGENNENPGVGGGVNVDGIALGSAEGLLRYEPGHPYANADGLVRYPDVDMGDQMSQLIAAQRAYQLNLSVVDRARERVPIGPSDQRTVIVAIPPIGALTPLTGASGTAATGGAKSATGGGFASALDNLQLSQEKADGLAVKAATGDLADVHAYTIAATEASLMTELTVAVRNRAVEAFNEIMRMPV